MKVTIISITGAATDVLATIPAKYVTVQQDGSDKNEALIVNYRNPDGTFSADVTVPAGWLIKEFRADGIIAMPPGYVAYQQPASGQSYLKVRTVSGAPINVQLIEYETIPFQQ